MTTLVSWLTAPDWLTESQAVELTGYDLNTLRMVIAEDGLDLKETDAGLLIGKDSLHEYQKTLAEVVHWRL